AARLDHLDLERQGQRDGEHVEPRPEICRRCRHTDQTPARQRHPSTARSIAPSSGSQGSTEPPRQPPGRLAASSNLAARESSCCSSAVCGSFSPWPVSTHTTRRASRAPCSSKPATLAAEAGSQKL